MYSDDLKKLIDAALVDGVITDKERFVIRKHAISEGVDPDEVDILLDAELYRRTKSPKLPLDNDINSILNKIAEDALRISKKYKDKKESFDNKKKEQEEVADAIKSCRVPSAKKDLLAFISIIYNQWINTTKSDDIVKTAYKTKYYEALSIAQSLYLKDKDFHQYFEKEKSIKKFFILSRMSTMEAFFFFYFSFFIILAIGCGVTYLVKEVDWKTVNFSKLFDFGGYDSYQDAVRANDYDAAHKILAEIEEDYLSESGYLDKKDKTIKYQKAFDYIFKEEALFLCANGDNESINRLVFLLSSVPIEGNAIPEGTEYTKSSRLPEEDHELYLKSATSYNQKCSMILDLAIANHIYDLAKKIIPLIKVIPEPLRGEERDEKYRIITHRVNYSWKDRENAIDKINRAIDDGVFPNVTEHIK